MTNRLALPSNYVRPAKQLKHLKATTTFKSKARIEAHRQDSKEQKS